MSCLYIKSMKSLHKQNISKRENTAEQKKKKRKKATFYFRSHPIVSSNSDSKYLKAMFYISSLPSLLHPFICPLWFLLINSTKQALTERSMSSLFPGRRHFPSTCSWMHCLLSGCSLCICLLTILSCPVNLQLLYLFFLCDIPFFLRLRSWNSI